MYVGDRIANVLETPKKLWRMSKETGILSKYVINQRNIFFVFQGQVVIAYLDVLNWFLQILSHMEDFLKEQYIMN